MEVDILIEKSSGGIKITNKNFMISNKITQKDFTSSDLYNEVFKQESNAYTHYNLKPQNIGNDKFLITLIFNPEGNIFMMNLRMQFGESLPSWSNWSEDQELKIKKEHDIWLKSNFGNPPYNYSWGIISSNYEPRSGSSSITFYYK